MNNAHKPNNTPLVYPCKQQRFIALPKTEHNANDNERNLHNNSDVNKIFMIQEYKWLCTDSINVHIWIAELIQRQSAHYKRLESTEQPIRDQKKQHTTQQYETMIDNK